MSETYFTADTHFGHANIIKFCDRPFDDVHQMNEGMIKQWNEQVKKGDSVYHLGDFSMGSKDLTRTVLNRLNGQIFLVRGNHDGQIKGPVIERFAWVKDYYELKSPIDKRKIVLCHFPFQVWNKSHNGAWHLHGHSHGTLKQMDIKRLDVGIDTNEMKLYTLEDIKKKMDKLGTSSIFPDHHGKNK